LVPPRTLERRDRVGLGHAGGRPPGGRWSLPRRTGAQPSATAMPRCASAQARRLKRGRTEEAARRKAKNETTRTRNCGGQVDATRKESWAPEFFYGSGNTIPIPSHMGLGPLGSRAQRGGTARTPQGRACCNHNLAICKLKKHALKT